MTITLGRQVGALASTLAITALGLTLAAPATAADAVSSRIGGADRWETSALISKETFATGVDVAYLATAIERLAGLDRFATSAAISADTFTSATTVYIANGLTFPDALSGAPAAASDDAPILLVKSDSVSQAVCDEVNRLQPENVVALGGSTAVSAAVLTYVAESCLADPTITVEKTNTIGQFADGVDYSDRTRSSTRSR